MNNFLQKILFQISDKSLYTLSFFIICLNSYNTVLYFYFLSKTAASLNILLKQLSEILNNQSQFFNNIKFNNRDNILDSETTTEFLTDDELKNYCYQYKIQQIETSCKICHIEKI